MSKLEAKFREYSHCLNSIMIRLEQKNFRNVTLDSLVDKTNEITPFSHEGKKIMVSLFLHVESAHGRLHNLYDKN